MGRKKIKIQPIKDDRNKQVKIYPHACLLGLPPPLHSTQHNFCLPIGHLFETQIWANEEGV
jgi:hypothetical protein